MTDCSDMLTKALATARAEHSYRSYCLAYDALHREAPEPTDALRVAIVGDFTLDSLVNCTTVALRLQGIAAAVWGGEPARLAEYVFRPESDLYRLHPDVVILALTEATWLPDLGPGWLDRSEAERRAAVDAALRQVAAWVETLLERTSANLFIHTVSPAAPCLDGLRDQQDAAGQHGLVEYINSRLRDLAACTPRLYVFDLDALVRQHGAVHAFDARMFVLQQYPFSRTFTVALADAHATALRALRGAARKCVVVDLDNTLWGGVVGEDGPQGVVLGDTPPGRAYRALQRALLAVRARGLLLAVCSKNNPEDAMEVLRQHPDMVLRPDHFAATRINWRDKPSNLIEIARELHIGTDALVFIDDDAFERELVRTRLPDVLVVDLPPDPAHYSRTVLGLGELEVLSLTEEDRVRAQRYEEQRERAAVRAAAGSLDEYLRNLEMRLQVVSPDPLSQARMLQLLQRTNQFNLTTRRYSEAEFRDLVSSPACRVYGLRVQDRFGDNGLVGLAIVRIAEGGWYVDSFLLSCRVLGRTVEHAFLQYVAAQAAAAGAPALVGLFIPTKKNAQVREFYRNAGFTLVHEADDLRSEWRLPLAGFTPSYPTWAIPG